MRVVEFTQDFASRKTGEVVPVDSMLASQLVHQEKVAKYYDKGSEKPKKGLFKKKDK